MASAIRHDRENSNTIVFRVMSGGLVLTGHLVTQLGFLLQISYLHATRYCDKACGTEQANGRARRLLEKVDEFF